MRWRTFPKPASKNKMSKEDKKLWDKAVPLLESYDYTYTVDK